ncbi:MAG: hypothetical protein ACJA0Q_000069 [Saprospiraceae bacterium]|jgi:hypothetical protein
MEQRIKLIWDFRNVEAEKIAEHHVKHLEEYIASKKVQNTSAHYEMVLPNHWIAYLITHKSMMIELRDALKPHRGERI